MKTHLPAFALLAALLAGCVGIEDYERKTDEAAGLRREIDEALAKTGALQRKARALEATIARKDREIQELGESLTMARRYSQRKETGEADLRARVASLEAEKARGAAGAGRLRRAYEDARARSLELRKSLLAAQKKLLRFEDRLRFQAQLEKDVKAQLARERRRGRAFVRRAGDRVAISIESALLFKSGSARVRTEGKPLLLKLAGLLRRYANREAQVQGHTDNVQISDRLAERWETNWELSAARATRVLRYFVEVGNLDPRRISAAGMGEFRPIGDNHTREGRRMNRRIEILIFPPDS